MWSMLTLLLYKGNGINKYDLLAIKYYICILKWEWDTLGLGNNDMLEFSIQMHHMHLKVSTC